jgi:hypothetical protein
VELAWTLHISRQALNLSRRCEGGTVFANQTYKTYPLPRVIRAADPDGLVAFSDPETGPDSEYIKGDFFVFSFLFYVRFSTLLYLPPPDFTVSEDAGIEPRTVAT